MRIGMVTACYTPLVNGVTQMVGLYQKELKEQGYDVTIFTMGRHNSGENRGEVYRSPGVPLGETGYYVGVRYPRIMQVELAQMDILHCHHLLMSVELARRYSSAPIVYTNHTRYDLYTASYTPFPQPVADLLMRSVWRRMTDLTDVVIAPTKGIAETMRCFGVRQPIEIIPNGIDLGKFHQPTERLSRREVGLPAFATPIFIYTGRLAAEKNLINLLQQFAGVQAELPASHLLIVGGGKLQAKLTNLANGLGIGENVTFVGEVLPARMPAFLALADIFVTASVSEVHPVSLIEAMAVGLPIVGVNAPGIADLVTDGKNGVLAESPNQLSEKMVMLGKDEGKCRQFSQHARHYSHQYSISNTVRQTIDLYEQLLR